MRPDSPPNDSDSSHVGCDDGPVWWLRGDRQCERAWRPIERVPAVRAGSRIFKLYRKDSPDRLVLVPRDDAAYDFLLRLVRGGR